MRSNNSPPLFTRWHLRDDARWFPSPPLERRHCSPSPVTSKRRQPRLHIWLDSLRRLAWGVEKSHDRMWLKTSNFKQEHLIPTRTIYAHTFVRVARHEHASRNSYHIENPGNGHKVKHYKWRRPSAEHSPGSRCQLKTLKQWLARNQSCSHQWSFGSLLWVLQIIYVSKISVCSIYLSKGIVFINCILCFQNLSLDYRLQLAFMLTQAHLHLCFW